MNKRIETVTDSLLMCCSHLEYVSRNLQSPVSDLIQAVINTIELSVELITLDNTNKNERKNQNSD